jgi:hypothetical protein
MLFHWLAVLVLLAHLAYLAFVVLGALLVLRRPRLAWVHLPAVAWGVYVEYAGIVCPLTPLENAMLARAGEQGYAGGFIAHYLTATIYPAGLTRAIEIALGTFALLFNAALYAWILRRRMRKSD